MIHKPMQTATIHDLKKELENTPSTQLIELCIRLAKYKKENKELLNYLLFESFDENAYIENINNETDSLFAEITQTNLYFVKKSIRKILRLINKHIRYTASKEAEVRLLIHFCQKMKTSGIPFTKSTALDNLYKAQIKKVNKTLDMLHEDLRYDYIKMLKDL